MVEAIQTKSIEQIFDEMIEAHTGRLPGRLYDIWRRCFDESENIRGEIS